MKNFVAYHKVAEWGSYGAPNEQGEFAHYSRHSQRRLEQTIDQNVWVIAGERQAGQMQYTLCAVYVPSVIEPVSDGGFDVVGLGGLLYPPIFLNEYAWFTELLREQNNFSFGLNEIRNPEISAALEDLLESFEDRLHLSSVQGWAVPSELNNPLHDVEPLAQGSSEERITERQNVVNSRVGQDTFRDDLKAYWGGCAVTGVCVDAVLRASHIKPWSCSTNQERLDPFNGLLLVGTLDLLFDAGLISFDESGGIMISAALSLADRELLGLNEAMQLRRIAPEHVPYLVFHRENVFHHE